MLFVRRNEISSNREYKLVNKPVEALVGKWISSKVMKEHKNMIYK
jgi:hypothetical protein